MSVLSHAWHNLTHNPGKFISNLGHTVGDAAKTAAPALPFFTPLGPLGAAAVGGLGSVLGGHNLGEDAKSAGLGLLGGTVQQGLSGGGWNPLAVLGNGGGAGAANSGGGGVLSGIEHALGGAASGLGHVLGQGANALGGGGGLGNLATLGLAGLQGWNAADLQKKADQYAKDALGTVQGEWAANAPMRTQGRQGILNPKAPDLGELSGIRGQLPTVPQRSY